MKYVVNTYMNKFMDDRLVWGLNLNNVVLAKIIADVRTETSSMTYDSIRVVKHAIRNDLY